MQKERKEFLEAWADTKETCGQIEALLHIIKNYCEVNDDVDRRFFYVRECFAIRNVSETFEWRIRQRSHRLAHVSVTSRWRRTAFKYRSSSGYYFVQKLRIK